MKIVAIGGGNNSDIRKDGTPQVYEHEKIDREIIGLTDKSSPNVLYVPHAGEAVFEYMSLNKILHTYRDMYHCPVDLFSFTALHSQSRTDDLIDWADIIYVAGGNTRKLIYLWKEFGIDKKLIEAAKENKVLCGTSAGASCWFNSCISDYLKMETGNENAPYATVDCLGLVDFVFNPHGDNFDRMIAMEELIKGTDKIGLSVSENAAVEIVDDQYKVLFGKSSEGLDTFAEICYYKDGEYWSNPIDGTGLVRNLHRR